MKRDAVVKLIANEIQKRNNTHPSYDATNHASDILKLLENFSLVRAKHFVKVTRKDIEGMPYEEEVEVSGWEKADNENT